MEYIVPQLQLSMQTNNLTSDLVDEPCNNEAYTQKCQGECYQKCLQYKKKYRIVPNTINNYFASLLLFPPAFFYTVFSTVISVMHQQISHDLKVEPNIIKLLVHIENTVCLMVMIVANRVTQKYGLYQVHCFGGLLVMIFSFIMSVIPNIYVLYAGSIISSIGYSLSLPTYVPLSRKLSKKNPQLTIAINNSVASAGSLLVVSLKQIGNPIQLSSWRIIYFIGGIIMIPYCVCCQIFLPFETAQKSIKVSILCVFLAMSANLILGMGVILVQSYITFDFSSQLGYILAATSFIFFALFWIQNKKASFPVIPRAVLNPNTVIFVTQVFFQGFSVQIDSAAEGTTWEKIFDIDENKQSLFTHLCKLTPIVAIPFIHLSIKLITGRWLLCLTSISLIFLQLLKILNIAFWAKNYYSLILINLFIAILYIQSLTTTQFYNVSSSPPRYGPISTSYITYCSKLAYVVSFVVQKPMKLIHDNTKLLAAYQAIAVIAASIGLQLSRKIGLFKFERGKLGYKEQKLMHCVTYPEMYEEGSNLHKRMKRKHKNYYSHNLADQLRLYQFEIEKIKCSRK